MTYLVERLVELRRHLDHLHVLRPRVSGRETLDVEQDRRGSGKPKFRETSPDAEGSIRAPESA